ncbi:MAG: hypothetical protein ACLUE8_04680 [Lachnospiraceae bacterium]
MVTGTAVMIGGLYGFDSGLFALSVVVAMIVIRRTTRRASAGRPARRPPSSIRF